MPKPNPELEEKKRLWRIWWRDTEESLNSVPGSWLRAYAKEVLEVPQRNGKESATDERGSQKVKGNKS